MTDLTQCQNSVELPAVVVPSNLIGFKDMTLPTIRIHQKSSTSYNSINGGKIQISGFSDVFYDSLNICVYSIDKKIFISNDKTLELYEIFEPDVNLEDHGYEKQADGSWFKPGFQNVKVSIKYIYDVVAVPDGENPVPAKLYMGGTSTPSARMINTKIVQHNTRYFTLSTVPQSGDGKEWFVYFVKVWSGADLETQNKIRDSLKDLQSIGDGTGKADSIPAIGYDCQDKNADDAPF